MREIRRADERYLTEGNGVSTRHSFSFGAHYDPDNVGFGPLIAINTERLEPGCGYAAHHHAEVEIVTWVLEGEVQHEDSTGHRAVILPGTVQRLSAGTGVQHSEHNASRTEPLEFVQMMLASEHAGEPDYAEVSIDPSVVLAETVDVRAPAQLLVAQLVGGHSVTVPAASRSLVHVTRGSVQLGKEGTVLTSGDEARLTDEDAYDLRAAADDGAAEVLIWQL